MRYFDHNATVPMHAEALAVLAEVSSGAWHNPSASYRAAARVRNLLESAREDFAGWLGCSVESVVFTSGATESNNAVFESAARLWPKEKRIAISALEHASVVEPARYYFRERLDVLPAGSDGRLCAKLLDDWLGKNPVVLVSVQAANNEVGIIQPLAELAEVCRQHGVLLHSDAVQWAGKYPLAALGCCDALSLAGHKFGGPRGAGILVASSALPIALLKGGGQESRKRSGTENVAGVLSMLKALELRRDFLPGKQERQMREEFIHGLRKLWGDEVRILMESGEHCLWNTVAFCPPHSAAVRWVQRLDREGIAIASGAACSTREEKISPTMKALGVSATQAARMLRVSSGWDTTAEQWQELLQAIRKVDSDLRAESENGLSPVIQIP